MNFISLGLQAKTFRGACLTKYCNTSGILLHTKEWIEGSRSLAVRFPSWNKLPTCYDKNVSYASSNPTSIITHVLSEYQHDELHKECKKIQEKLLLNESISQIDLQYLIPTSIGRGIQVHQSISSNCLCDSKVGEF